MIYENLAVSSKSFPKSKRKGLDKKEFDIKTIKEDLKI